MKLITVKPNQTLYDIALEQYGTCEALYELLEINHDLKNEPAALAAAGIDGLSDDGFYIDTALLAGSAIKIDANSKMILQSVIREITGDITTYDYGTDN